MTTTGMRPIRETIPFAEALELMLEAIEPVSRTERVELDTADGRVVAREVVAVGDVPPFDRAAMDGYAVRAEDTFGASREAPRRLRVLEKVLTGGLPSTRVGTGESVEIATGAPLPDGADAVVMGEETAPGDAADEVEVFTPVYPGQNVGRRGADIKADQVVARVGDVLNPARLGALAATGLAGVDVFARPRVAILSTGNEIVDPGQPLAPGQIYDINRFTLAAVVRRHGGVAVVHRPVPDAPSALSAALDRCVQEDLVVFSGGSSVGEHDLILDVIRARGDVLFHGIAVKPGKPTLVGRVGGTLVIGMPGYPTSCLSNAYLLLVPVLRRLAHLPPYRPRTVQLPLAQRIVSTTGRHQFYTVRVVDGQAVPAFKQSGDITSMSLADGYIEIPAQTDIVEKGELVEVKLL